MIARLQEKRQELVRFAKFCVVGTIGTFIDFGILNLCYDTLGWPQVLSNILSSGTATVNNYMWSRFWVYPETRHQQGGKKFVQFVIVSLIAIALSSLILKTTDAWIFGPQGLLRGWVAPVAAWIGWEHSTLSNNIAKVIATGIVLFWNFFANRMWTFRDVDQVRPQVVVQESKSG